MSLWNEKYEIKKVLSFSSKFILQTAWIRDIKQLNVFNPRKFDFQHREKINLISRKILTLKLTSYGILHYLWSGDLSKSFFQLIM